MNTARDAILGYAQELHAYYIQFIENDTVLDHRYGLICPMLNEEQAEQVMTTLILKKSFWMNGSNFADIVKGLQPLAVDSIH